MSPNGSYLASGCNDRSIVVWEEDNPYPWRMQGFPGKVRQLAWSTPKKAVDAPLLASISAEDVVVWTKDSVHQSAGIPRYWTYIREWSEQSLSNLSHPCLPPLPKMAGFASGTTNLIASPQRILLPRLELFRRGDCRWW